MSERASFDQDINSPERLLQASVDKGVRQALQLIEESFGPNRGDDHLSFHGREHTEGGIRRAEIIAAVLVETGDITEPEALIAKLGIGYHDIVQEYTLKPDSKNPRILKRERQSGLNETASLLKGTAYMREENSSSWTGCIYSEEYIDLMGEGIWTTISKWDPESGTVVQPYLTRNTSKAAAIFALADLGGAGIDGGHKSIRECDQLFVEENIDIARAIRRGDIGDEAAHQYKERILSANKQQIGFIRGRQSRLDTEIAMFSPEGQRRLKEEVFVHFDDAVQIAEAAYVEREQMDARDLLNHVAGVAGINPEFS
jgi:hypothetical protein